MELFFYEYILCTCMAIGVHGFTPMLSTDLQVAVMHQYMDVNSAGFKILMRTEMHLMSVRSQHNINFVKCFGYSADSFCFHILLWPRLHKNITVVHLCLH